ncbi:N-acetylmuramoyl-L-alanine amidase [Anoxybacillus vitaminiphilus]|uniref:N-acetylmuramoyl-L-alanine amidase n=1 Tax=Paranoxybacillus vitaminiphilus TaxID=581036 RepID=A0A327YHT7_9BACL|nr:N-acetylmuramoyl-L-alanine amidase [Anoxybacillus vitaminiphilus]RAK19902.1 N-acetylmuramoyl-L-alanine amidase [Anoxybacillus vitaminiphilus]
MRLLLSFIASVFILFPFAAAVSAEEQEERATHFADQDLLLEIQDFNQSPPQETSNNNGLVHIASTKSIFSDVPSDHWAIDEIHFLYNRSIITGYENDQTLQFLPNRHVTRAQAAKMLVKALGYSELEVSKPTFTDVGHAHWALGWIERAVKLGLFTGYDDGSFRPNEPLKRSHMSKVIAIAFQLPLDSSKMNVQVFSDVNKKHWAYSYILKLYYNGISNGNQNRFMPEQYISRDQFSAFLARALNKDFRLPVTGKVIATGKVTAQALNVRSEPNANAKIVGKLSLGNVVNVYEINGYWAKITYGNQSGYVHKSYLKLKNVDGNVLRNRIIVVDAGHGGEDPGAIGSGTNEKTVVLSVAQKLKEKLQSAGANVIMTRDDDTFKSLEERVEIAKKHYAELFVSIHNNSAASSKAYGTETYYDTSTNPNGYESYLLAKEIQSQIVKNADMYDRGVKDNRFYVIRNNNVPSVLVELGFISNSNDAKKLTSNQYQEIFAQSIYNGIVQYYSN